VLRHGDETYGRLDADDITALARQQGLELLTAQEVADRLRIGKSTVYLLCRRGELPCLFINRSVRIPADALRRWLAERVRAAETAIRGT